MKMLILLAALVTSPSIAAQNTDSPYRHAQILVDETAARNPGMIDVIMHVSPNDRADNIVIAAHLRKANGEPSGDDDMSVVKTGAPLIEIQKDGVRLGIVVQMRDARRRTIGALGLMYAYKPGDDVEAAVDRSFAIRDRLATQISSRDALVSGG